MLDTVTVKEGGFEVLRDAGLALFYPRVFGFSLKTCGFSGFTYLTGNGFCHFLSSGFGRLG